MRGAREANVSLLLIFLPPAIPAIWLIALLSWSHLLLIDRQNPIRPKTKPTDSTITRYKPVPLKISRISSIERLFKSIVVVAGIILAPVGLFLLNRELMHHPSGSSDPEWSIWLHPGLLLAYHGVLWGTVWGLLVSLGRKQTAKVQRLTWATQPEAERNKTLEAGEEGFVLADPCSTLSYKWTAISKFIETEHLFVLYPSDYLFYIVPKRAFATEEDALAYLSLLSRSVISGFVLDQPRRGFPVLPIEQLEPVPAVTAKEDAPLL